MHLYNKRPSLRRIPLRGGKDGIIEERRVDNRNAVNIANQPDAVKSTNDQLTAQASNETDWQAMAIRLQADMDNFRQRQQRRADEAIATEQKRLLRLILPVADNLIRALNHQQESDETLHQGVELTYRELMRLLEAEGVTRLETVGHSFTPRLHEAIATVPTEAEPNIIVEEVEAGYKLGDQLLRPARVVVAT